MQPWRRPFTFTALVPASVEAEALRIGLDRQQADINAALSKRDDIHTLRMCSIPPNNGQGTRLMVNFVHDQPLDKTLPSLCNLLTPLLAPIGVTFNTSLLMSCRQKENTYHIGAQGMTVKQILADAQLSIRLSKLADVIPNGPAEPIRLQLRDQIKPVPEVRTGQLRKWINFLVCALFPLLNALKVDLRQAIAAVETTGWRIFFQCFYWIWRLYSGIPSWLSLASVHVLEIFEKDIIAPQPAEAHLSLIESREDLTLKNPVTFWLPVRDSWVRRYIVHRVILLGSEIGCRHIWTRGSLATIDTIHHARIMRVDSGRTMLFMSDYDGSLNRYLDDFMGDGKRAVIPISSSLAGCPKTHWLNDPQDPIAFGPRYKALLRLYQIDTPVWFHAYPQLSIREIVDNRRRRQDLCATSMQESRARKFVRSIR